MARPYFVNFWLKKMWPCELEVNLSSVVLAVRQIFYWIAVIFFFFFLICNCVQLDGAKLYLQFIIQISPHYTQESEAQICMFRQELQIYWLLLAYHTWRLCGNTGATKEKIEVLHTSFPFKWRTRGRIAFMDGNRGACESFSVSVLVMNHPPLLQWFPWK